MRILRAKRIGTSPRVWRWYSGEYVDVSCWVVRNYSPVVYDYAGPFRPQPPA